MDSSKERKIHLCTVMILSVVLKVTNYVSATVKGLAVNAIQQNDVPAVPRLFLTLVA